MHPDTKLKLYLISHVCCTIVQQTAGHDMSDSKPKFRRESPEHRREQLIEATLRVIARKGVSAATVREISAEAGVAFSLIRHHFRTKEDLMYAAYSYHMRKMAHLSLSSATDVSRPIADRVRQCVRDTLSAPVASGEGLQIWAGFIQMVPHDARMKQIHIDTYLGFRDALEPLITEALRAQGAPADPKTVEEKAIACNAVLDGLWLEGSMLPEMLPAHRLTDVAEATLFAILGLSPTD
ncbi:TetR/AcrR family transcriptional regulator (plasmid) [Tritonibacter scottomollicae]|uniref:TetR/AcrR family transcriptional regulator n=1 Tax=Tritonibacter scottomollicae TaxID=483013 RepID=A0ABZ0HAE7_TRISK|nr:TetR/AcrR family transcriptional regulator [Tritonibacter scottomollicae]WOI31436.1 TetR/AcrR family transcriptional regulator [Tritonibacter scottomollicae]